ncbi:Spx/MgsR family RNA polymerase-binding regulatory protein [Vreelandella massiliensis]|uniref:Spx/MgsR family RNA polymerase-binding regulatory protein n=1 Tax=Vreelandella massiliensis TaxID=1816686 RepID=UPI00096A6782|nr:Spx/MgsR family RNA polymerase-binding regulatory protein [Halomonas massiliensis]MYL22260.1 Spx/MgsR family RNA polymerase-binding regulatory protein [Halomonas alkaliantarctica]
MLTLYLIHNCDTCRKARKALDAKGMPFKTHDLRKDGLSAPLLEHILNRVPLVEAINKRSKTWRELSEEEKDFDANSGRELLLKHPTLLKRPLLELNDGTIIVGYQDGDYDKLA